jgi:hypothetical protein
MSGVLVTVTATPISRTDAITATKNPKTNVRHIATAVLDVPERGADTPPGPTDCAAVAAEVPERVSGTAVSSVPLWRACPSVSSAPCLATAALAEGINSAMAPAPNTNVIAAPTASDFILLLFVVFIVSAFPLREVRPVLALGEPSQPQWEAVDQTSALLPQAGGTTPPGTPPTQGEVPAHFARGWSSTPDTPPVENRSTHADDDSPELPCQRTRTPAPRLTADKRAPVTAARSMLPPASVVTRMPRRRAVPHIAGGGPAGPRHGHDPHPTTPVGGSRAGPDRRGRGTCPRTPPASTRSLTRPNR